MALQLSQSHALDLQVVLDDEPVPDEPEELGLAHSVRPRLAISANGVAFAGRCNPTTGATTMNARQMKNGSLLLVPAAMAAMLVVQACGGGGDALANEQADPLEGVWESAVTQRDCTSGATPASFRAPQVIHRGGGLTDTNVAPPASRGVGFGTWAYQSDGRYAIKFRFFRYNADGSVAGTTVVTSTRTLGLDGNSATGDTRAEVCDVAG